MTHKFMLEAKGENDVTSCIETNQQCSIYFNLLAAFLAPIVMWIELCIHAACFIGFHALQLAFIINSKEL